jgi:hypothetical protein
MFIESNSYYLKKFKTVDKNRVFDKYSRFNIPKQVFLFTGMKLSGDTENRRLWSFITFYSSPDISTMIKSRRMRWTEHVARMER